MDEFRVYCGKVLREIRKRRGLSAEEIGRRQNMNPQAIYCYEQGRYLPKSKNAEKLFSALQIHKDVFESLIHVTQKEEPIVESKYNPILQEWVNFQNGTRKVPIGAGEKATEIMEASRRAIDYESTTGYPAAIESFSEPIHSVPIQTEHDVFLHEILSVWPKLSRSGKMKVAAFAVELLEKSGAGASEEDLGKDRAKHA